MSISIIQALTGDGRRTHVSGDVRDAACCLFEQGEGGDEEKGEEYYHYHLAGVVVHMGTANSGHYYSYIRQRDGGGEWLEFNDTVVSAFDVKVRTRWFLGWIRESWIC